MTSPSGQYRRARAFVDHGHLRRIVPAVRVLQETPSQQWNPHRSPVVARDRRNVVNAQAAAGRGHEASGRMPRGADPPLVNGRALETAAWETPGTARSCSRSRKTKATLAESAA